MILNRNLRRVCDRAVNAGRVLAVGVADGILNAATHVIDPGPVRAAKPLDPHNQPRFSEQSWTQTDLCSRLWPYPDNYFDFAVCSHLLEDVRDPLAVLREISRVSRAGYIETPSRACEIFVRTRYPHLTRWLGRKLDVGFAHHRWYVENIHGRFRFLAKTNATISSPDFVLTRGELGRDLTEEESGLGVFWSDRTEGEELTFANPRDLGFALRGFKQRILYHLKQADPGSPVFGNPRLA